MLRNRIAKVALRLKRSFAELDSAVQNSGTEEYGGKSVKLLHSSVASKNAITTEKSKDVSSASEFKDLVSDIASII